jgi:hypothetical protein
LSALSRQAAVSYLASGSALDTLSDKTEPTDRNNLAIHEAAAIKARHAREASLNTNQLIRD